MKKERIWESSGWPWGLEMLALVFVLAAIIVPLRLAVDEPVDMESLTIVQRSRLEKQQDLTFDDTKTFFWGLGILGLYGVHLLMGASAINQISTSFAHLFSPLIFSIITYYRLAGLDIDVGGDSRIVLSHSPLEFALWVLIVLGMTIILARIRAIRHGMKFKRIKWDATYPTVKDGTYWSELALSVRPLFYAPKTYLTSAEGILVKGWIYNLPLSFQSIQSVESVRKARVSESALFYATSTKALVRIQVKESKQPIYISPADRETFIAYCNRHLSRGVVSLARDDSDDDE